MSPYRFAAAAALLAAIPSVAAVGSTTITNQCNYPVYLWSVAETAGMMHTLDSNGGSYSETYRTNANGGGISIKMSNQKTLYGTPITQFEYTLDGMIWYDISNINGYPFSSGGLQLTPSVSGCPTVNCAAGVGVCSQVYNVPNNNLATGACADTANLAMVLCPGNGGSNGSDNTPPPAAPPAHTKAAAKPSKKKKTPPKPPTTVALSTSSSSSSTPPAAPPTVVEAATHKHHHHHDAKPQPATVVTHAVVTPDPVVVTTMVTKVVTPHVNIVKQAPTTSSVNTDWWIGHYPASWASFPQTIARREAEPTAHAHAHHHHPLRHLHGHHH